MIDIGPKVTWAKFGPIWSKNEIAPNRGSLGLLTVFCGAICRSEVRGTDGGAQKLSDLANLSNFGHLEVGTPKRRLKTFIGIRF